MPKYRVTTKDPGGSARQSMDFPSEQAATDDAQRALVDMAKETLPNGERARFKVRVQDQAGDEVYRASLDFKGRGRRKTGGPEEPADD
ncbi:MULTISPECIES: hypothetical protein [unclassified Bosea (in: a-proteobacteria)]|uniref:DUF6894 family protein n=1 Tax=unclassified Bosea (in: a-proteobacteria) TaxID=2653178 RepID=UPI000F7D713C|nr:MULTISPECIES: hypothetical protein [unclassified Bosea (in: a-proteobacteria)]